MSPFPWRPDAPLRGALWFLLWLAVAAGIVLSAVCGRPAHAADGGMVSQSW